MPISSIMRNIERIKKLDTTEKITLWFLNEIYNSTKKGILEEKIIACLYLLDVYRYTFFNKSVTTFNWYYNKQGLVNAGSNTKHLIESLATQMYIYKSHNDLLMLNTNLRNNNKIFKYILQQEINGLVIAQAMTVKDEILYGENLIDIIKETKPVQKRRSSRLFLSHAKLSEEEINEMNKEIALIYKETYNLKK